MASLLFAAAAWSAWVVLQIHNVGTHDEAQPADAIAVLGAAEYHGHPSPVLRARLDHTLDLYREHIAPVIVTTGGEDDLSHSEGGVGRDFLTSQGVPPAAIIAETLSESTQEAVTQLAGIARAHGFRTIVVVSDGTHLFRVREMCRAAGLTVFTSPRQWKQVSVAEKVRRTAHEVLSYTAWKLHLSGIYD